MAEAFLSLSPADHLEALGVAASASGRPAHILEKDTWVVWALSALFESSFGEHLVFKGGTSLSKVYQAIRRFSEDIDLTYDIRAFAPELVEAAGADALPPNNSQQQRWSKAIRDRLPGWIASVAQPYIEEKLGSANLRARARSEGDCLYIEYTAHASGYEYVRPRVMVEFGARSTGEPASVHTIHCDAAEFLQGLSFPSATPRVMHAERTFWEKATAIHVFNSQGKINDRLSRHWYDVAKLDAAGYVGRAVRDRELAAAVARHKQWFFAAKGADGQSIDYLAAINGRLCLVPTGATLEALAADYAKMIDDGLFLDEPEAFETILGRCRTIQDQVNALHIP